MPTELCKSLEIPHNWTDFVPTELCKALETPHNWRDFRHGPPEAAHTPMAIKTHCRRKDRKESSRDLEKPIDCEYVIIPFGIQSGKKQAGSSGWITISAVTHSSACPGNWLPASLPRSCSPNYTDHPTLKLNFPNCYINIKLHIEEWSTQNGGN